MQRFELSDGRRQAAPSSVLSVSTSRESEGQADVTLQSAGEEVTFQVEYRTTFISRNLHFSSESGDANMATMRFQMPKKPC